MLRRLSAVLTVMLALTACGDGLRASDAPIRGPAAGDTSSPATGEGDREDAGQGLTAVATVFPLAWMAEQVAPGAEVLLLGARGQDPHDLELSPGDRAALETADIVAYLGDLGFQPQVEAAVADRSGETVDVRAAVGDDRLREVADDDHDDDHDDAAHDPHVWFDPAAMAEVADALGDAFAAADSADADTYRGRAAKLRDTLVALHAELDNLLSDCRLQTAIVSHEAYAYLLEPRGFEQEGISGTGGHGDASPQRLAGLTRHIRERGVRAVLVEPFEGREAAEALAAEAGVQLIEIDPLEIVGEEEHAIGYPALLRRQAEAFATALECG